jgi:hypothetical protein
MKKSILIVLLLLISIGNVEKVFASSLQSTEAKLEVVKHQELSIKQALKLAYPSALKWNKNAQLHDAINIDLDKPGKLIGSNGKRKYWNVQFGVPDTNKVFLVTIHNGKIDQTNDISGGSPQPKKEFMELSEINYDSPDFLKRALKMGSIYPGNDWAKGYNFWLRKDPERNINLLLVIGWNSDQTKMKATGFNVSTGEYVEPN